MPSPLIEFPDIARSRSWCRAYLGASKIFKSLTPRDKWGLRIDLCTLVKEYKTLCEKKKKFSQLPVLQKKTRAIAKILEQLKTEMESNSDDQKIISRHMHTKAVADIRGALPTFLNLADDVKRACMEISVVNALKDSPSDAAVVLCRGLIEIRAKTTGAPFVINLHAFEGPGASRDRFNHADAQFVLEIAKKIDGRLTFSKVQTALIKIRRKQKGH